MSAKFPWRPFVPPVDRPVGGILEVARIAAVGASTARRWARIGQIEVASRGIGGAAYYLDAVPCRRRSLKMAKPIEPKQPKTLPGGRKPVVVTK